MKPAKIPGLDALQKGCFTALTATLLRVYDEAPEGATFPYTSIGESSVTGSDSKTDNSDDVFETFHVWSRAKGFKELKQLCNTIIQAISGYQFAEPGYQIRFIELDSINTMRDPDGLTRHAVIRLKFKIFQE